MVECAGLTILPILRVYYKIQDDEQCYANNSEQNSDPDDGVVAPVMAHLQSGNPRIVRIIVHLDLVTLPVGAERSLRKSFGIAVFPK